MSYLTQIETAPVSKPHLSRLATFVDWALLAFAGVACARVLALFGTFLTVLGWPVDGRCALNVTCYARR